MSKKIFKIGIIFIVIFGWVFSGWPAVWQNPEFPPKVEKIYAAEIIYNTPGSYFFDWSVELPEGVTEITVEVWGGGGEGKGGIGNDGGGGGGGGGYAKAIISLPGSGVSLLRVGAGGSGAGAGAAGNNGEDSWFRTDAEIPGFSVYATGGTGATSTVLGAPGGAGTIGSYTFTGGAGGAGASHSKQGRAGGGGGSSAGSVSNGNNGGNALNDIPGDGGVAPADGGAGGSGGTSNNDGSNAGIPGGGGGGGGNFLANYGGDGGAGQVKITYVVISISVDPESFDYGMMNEGDIKRATAVNPPGAAGIIATSTSSVVIDLYIYGGDASSTQTTNWTLAAATSTDQYTHEFADDLITPIWTDIGNGSGNQKLLASIGVGEDEDFDLRIHIPGTSTDIGPFYAPVTLVAVDGS